MPQLRNASNLPRAVASHYDDRKDQEASDDRKNKT